MNKIIPTISVVLLCGCATKQIKTSDVSNKTDEMAKKAQVYRHSQTQESSMASVNPSQYLPHKHRLISDRPFRQHTVIPVNKSIQHRENDQLQNKSIEGEEKFIPRIAHYIKRGIASWYGKKFHGKKTATGEIFDMYALTAAHKTLPIPSYAEVTNLENNKSVIVRINDRGPFTGNRLLDLSYAAAKKLDIHKEGTAKVEVKALPEKVAKHLIKNNDDSQGKNFYLHLGTFYNPDKAQKIQDKVAANHLPEAEILPSTHKDLTRYEVQIGPIKSQSGAEKLTLQLAKLGITGTQIITETNKNEQHMIQ